MHGRIFQASDVSTLLGDCRHVPTSGVVYILEAHDGRVKVGRSKTPRGRIKAYSAQLVRFTDTTLKQGWVSTPHESYHATEYALLEYARKRATTVRKREYFLGVPFNDVVTQATSLEYPSSSQSTSKRLDEEVLPMQDADDWVKALWSTAITTFETGNDDYEEITSLLEGYTELREANEVAGKIRSVIAKQKKLDTCLTQLKELLIELENGSTAG